LSVAVKKYGIFKEASSEKIACKYGYSIDKWDVSQLEDMSYVFHGDSKNILGHGMLGPEGSAGRGVVNSWFPSFNGVNLPTTSRCILSGSIK
jgi:hypothetical protein